MKHAALSFSALSLCLATVCGAGVLPQERPPEAKPATQTVGTCNQGWESIPAKVPDPKVALTLVTTKSGLRRLQWSAHKAELVTQFIRKAKGPVNRKGEVEVCGVVLRISTFTDSNTVSIRDLKDTNSLPSGLYAVRVVIGGNDYAQGATSDWLTLRIE
jgi:hypothetical protein